VKRRKALKISIVVFVLLVFALSGGVVLLYNFYPRDSVLAILSAQAEKELKRNISIEDLDYSLRGIVLRKLKLHNGPSDCPGILASADDAVVRFSLLRLVFKREFDINFINIIGLNLSICYKDGTSNLENLITDLSTDDSSSVAARLDTIKLSRARISSRTALFAQTARGGVPPWRHYRLHRRQITQTLRRHHHPSREKRSRPPRHHAYLSGERIPDNGRGIAREMLARMGLQVGHRPFSPVPGLFRPCERA
jgi:hypothetical protein